MTCPVRVLAFGFAAIESASEVEPTPVTALVTVSQSESLLALQLHDAPVPQLNGHCRR